VPLLNKRRLSYVAQLELANAGSLFGSASCRRIDFYDGSEAVLELPSVEAMTLN